MKTHNKSINKQLFNMTLVAACLGCCTSQVASANGITDALISGKADINLNLRYETVSQDNALKDAHALTLRTLLAYQTGSYQGFLAKIEMEDTRIVLGQGDYTVGPSGYNLGKYSVIADPEHTELDQAYLQYKSNKLSVKLGRQVITMDGHRFVGHVGWRQDRQTFDALRLNYALVKNVSFEYAYITQRNRIFGQDADIDAKDQLFNLSFKTQIGTLTGYGYLLEVDNTSQNALDTLGVSFIGNVKAGDTTILYHAQYASQNSQSEMADYDVNYLKLTAGVVVSSITASLGYEVLGSDKGEFGFATPLATLHKFNGWADQFLSTPTQGLVDTSLSLAGKAAGGSWKVVYHHFSADQASETVDELGSEINLSYVKKYAANYTAGIKYAAYSAGDIKVDTDKLWLWMQAKF